MLVSGSDNSNRQSTINYDIFLICEYDSNNVKTYDNQDDTNECDFNKTDRIPKTTLNINKWIYSELNQTKDKIEKNLKDYRFDL